MSIEASMVSYYADRAQEYERIYHKPERQVDLGRLRGFVETEFSGADVFEVVMRDGILDGRYWRGQLASCVCHGYQRRGFSGGTFQAHR